MKASQVVVSTSRKVLVLDDEPEIIGLIKLILHEKYDDDVIGAVGGNEGLAKAQEHQPDLIILDIMMPSPDGYEVCKRLKAIPEFQNVPIVFIAAKPAKDVYPMAQSLGAVGYVQEPFGPQDLFAACNAALSGNTYYPPFSKEG